VSDENFTRTLSNAGWTASARAVCVANLSSRTCPHARALARSNRHGTEIEPFSSA